MGLFDKIFGGENNNDLQLNWKNLTDASQLDEIIKDSHERPVAIFKHSTRCSISSMAKQRLERNWDIEGNTLDVYYLDLLTYRPVSNQIARDFGVEHASPQLILIKDGKAVFDTSHNAISVEGLKSAL